MIMQPRYTMNTPGSFLTCNPVYSTPQKSRNSMLLPSGRCQVWGYLFKIQPEKGLPPRLGNSTYIAGFFKLAS